MLVRATFDLPLGIDEHQPMAAYRAHGLGATLQWLLAHGARVTVFGDVGGEGDDRARRLARVQQVVDALAPGVAVVGGPPDASIEDPDLVTTLIESHQQFVNDSFQSSYLPLPSLMLPAERLPSAVGRGLQHDLELLDDFLVAPERPFVAILGGDHPFLGLHGLRGLVLRADTVLVGGAMAVPLLQAVGKQPRDGMPEDFLDECRNAYGLGRTVLHQVNLPWDLTWATDGGTPEVATADVRPDGQVVDVGPVTRRRFAEAVEAAAVVLWLGALGRVEDPRCGEGTRTVGRALAAVQRRTVLGGDALVSFLDEEHLLGGHTHLLSATDAALELLKNGNLPALMPLQNN